MSMPQPCSQEEAAMRALLHLKHAGINGHTKVFLRTADTDWVVNASYIFAKLTELEEFWIGYGSGKTYRDIPLHNVSLSLEISDARPFPYFIIVHVVMFSLLCSTKARTKPVQSTRNCKFSRVPQTAKDAPRCVLAREGVLTVRLLMMNNK